MALRQGANPPQFLLGDHLGSTTRTASAAGATSGMQLYRPWGETHYASGSLLTQYQYTGQWKSASGLYWYNSRWYDPGIIQFNQPDTLVPDPYNPLDFNRYSYARYNPVKFKDPSGHVPVCDDFSNYSGCDGPARSFEDMKSNANITFSDMNGRWGSSSINNVIKAALLMGLKVMPYLSPELNITDPIAAFNYVFGAVIVTFERVAGADASGNAGMNSIAFSGESLTGPGLVIHEFGHVFDMRKGNGPYTDIDNAGVSDSQGSHVFGTPTGSTAYRRTLLGYTSEGVPGIYHGPNDFDDFFTNAHEDFADMFVNWVRNSFDYSQGAFGAGIARYDWMSQHMAGWLSLP